MRQVGGEGSHSSVMVEVTVSGPRRCYLRPSSSTNSCNNENSVGDNLTSSLLRQTKRCSKSISRFPKRRVPQRAASSQVTAISNPRGIFMAVGAEVALLLRQVLDITTTG